MADATPTPAHPATPASPSAPTPATPATPAAKLKVNDIVKYPGCPDGTFVSGVGKIVAIDKDVVTVEIDHASGKLNKNFKESELTRNAN